MERQLLGERLRIARARQRMSQLDLVIALEERGLTLTQSTIGKIERGERNLYVHQLVALAETLDISLDWAIYGGELDVK
ncbi:helix-turn-helix domain-containing protein [Gilvimarinus algae]|uniref:Helix-turn-helix domain-containing protein n=1 Tax=Gilvimarinus algae TaxID=3058037 RepID=A0ABT8TKZ4_9GAMM|nr:helix-turn-helix domain-containing protein [Gilvimarinus sp. SDUM040014]MDO3383306.1 helix-turn-helix domain-containing protein [Gilvimarinus sp. SDUM040014]